MTIGVYKNYVQFAKVERNGLAGWVEILQALPHGYRVRTRAGGELEIVESDIICRMGVPKTNRVLAAPVE